MLENILWLELFILFIILGYTEQCCQIVCFHPKPPAPPTSDSDYDCDSDSDSDSDSNSDNDDYFSSYDYRRLDTAISSRLNAPNHNTDYWPPLLLNKTNESAERRNVVTNSSIFSNETVADHEPMYRHGMGRQSKFVSFLLQIKYQMGHLGGFLVICCELCISCIPPRPTWPTPWPTRPTPTRPTWTYPTKPTWTTPTRPTWTTPTRPTWTTPTRPTWTTPTQPTWTTPTHPPWTTPTLPTTTTQCPTTTSTPHTTYSTTASTHTTTDSNTTTENPTTTPSIPDVIIPHEDDNPPMFTATISTPNEEPVCSATIISSHFLLSSCIRCLQKSGRAIPSENVVVLVGDLQPDEISGLGIASYEVKGVVLHPNCFHDGRYDLKHDIGMLQTYEEIEYGHFVKAATIPQQIVYLPDDNRNWIIAAFRPRNTIARTLREAVWFVKVRTIQPRTCQKILNGSYYDKTRNYCTPYHHSGRIDSCWDDFGASLSLDNTLIGLLIHKFGCGKSGTAGSFVGVAYNSEWIRGTVHKLSNGAEFV